MKKVIPLPPPHFVSAPLNYTMAVKFPSELIKSVSPDAGGHIPQLERANARREGGAGLGSEQVAVVGISYLSLMQNDTWAF